MIQTRQKGNNKIFYVISGIVLGMGILGLVVLNLKSSSVYFFTVNEVCAKKLNDHVRLRVFGRVKEIKRDLNRISFKLMDRQHPNKWIEVSYKGFLPDTFRIGADVIVEGFFKDHIFFAQKLMTKCPSKYQSK